MPYREKYFYTVLFLDDYYPERDRSSTAPEDYRPEKPELKSFEITKDSNSENVKWLDEEKTTLYVRHNLRLPVTLEMWNDEGKPIFYCPILKEGIESISVGQVVIESSRSLTLHFNENVKAPEEGETFRLSIKTLPDFDTQSERQNDAQILENALEETILTNQRGLAIVFRRNSLDAHFDLLVDFDESYFHSIAEGSDLQYLTRRSKFRNVKWLTKYTNNMQDVLDDINTRYYEIRFSWKENGTQWYRDDDPFGYQRKVGHLPHPDWHRPDWPGPRRPPYYPPHPGPRPPHPPF